MLNQHELVANLAVKDLAAAQAFYEDTLGLQLVAEEGDMLLVFQTGASRLFVYQSEFAGSNRATAATWVVGDAIEAETQQLKAKGVRFEHYAGLPDLRIEGDLHIGDGVKIAWFKDPDGNILSLVSG